jgi:hypothetical protein
VLPETLQMDAASGPFVAVLTIARAVGLAVLATEALFLWSRRGESALSPQPPFFSRLFWAATPAAVLASLALWCLSSVAPPRSIGEQRLAVHQPAGPAD